MLPQYTSVLFFLKAIKVKGTHSPFNTDRNDQRSFIRERCRKGYNIIFKNISIAKFFPVLQLYY